MGDGWVDLCGVDEVPAGGEGGKYVLHGDHALAVWRVDDDGEVRVLDDTCPHAGASLSAGSFDTVERCIVCPWHSWAFEVDSGQCPDNREIAVRCHEARVINGRVQVKWENA